MKEKPDTILICPLNWGLGHAARCIPLISELLQQRNNVIIAGEGLALDLLQEEFPTLPFVQLKGAEIRYTANGFSFFWMLIHFPAMLWSVFAEHRCLQHIIAEYKIDAVIADNRYGLWSRRIKSIFITHQLYIRLPSHWKWMEGIVNAINFFFIKKFNECWIPDEPGNRNISGDLSHNDKFFLGAKYIGPLSRFNTTVEQACIEQYEVLVILSGPEPARTSLEEILTEQLTASGKHVLIVRGQPKGKKMRSAIGNISFRNHLPTRVLKYHLLHSQYIICRSGYSSLMDLAAVGRSAIIIPTPGQTEQEYLAVYHHNKGHHFRMLQERIDLDSAFAGILRCKPLVINTNSLAHACKSIFERDG